MATPRWVFVGNLAVPIPSCISTNGTHPDQWVGPTVELLTNHLITVSSDGIIEQIVPSTPERLSAFLEHPGLIKLSPNEFLCPGFIDLHIHAPQFVFTGTATDRPLTGKNGWLETYTFPAEQKMKTDLNRAKLLYGSVVETTLSAGTTTALYFATLDLSPTKVLVDQAVQQGQRALVGKVCMDRNSPENYCHSLEQNLTETEELIEYIHTECGKKEKDGMLPLVLPVVTPRFIPTCSPALMRGLGEIAEKFQCHVTSHISESYDEVAWSRQIDATEDLGDGAGRSDAAIFDSHGLLTDQCVMAHGVLVDDKDLALMRKRGAAVASCPCSNFIFAGKSLECKRLLKKGNKLGLGTDVAGGYSPSMMDSCRMAVVASQSLQHGSLERKASEDHVLDYQQAFYLGTMGGAQALGLDDRIGTLAVGMEFDAIVLSADVPSRVRVFDADTVEDRFQKLCVLGDDRNVKQVFVQGRLVKDKTS